MPAIIAVVVSLLALGLAAAAFFKPKHDDAPAAPQYSDQQVADAKKNLCDAYNSVYRAATKAGSFTSENPDQKYMIALDIRLAFNASADYLLNIISQNPAAPKELTDAARSLATAHQRMVLTQTADAPHEELEAIYKDADAAEAAVKKACG